MQQKTNQTRPQHDPEKCKPDSKKNDADRKIWTAIEISS
jgi:hypothetical protein